MFNGTDNYSFFLHKILNSIQHSFEFRSLLWQIAVSSALEN